MLLFMNLKIIRSLLWSSQLVLSFYNMRLPMFRKSHGRNQHKEPSDGDVKVVNELEVVYRFLISGGPSRCF